MAGKRPSHFTIPYGKAEEHAAQLKHGLDVLGPDFRAKICFACGGQGQYQQTYTAGCGGGHYHTFGPCEACGSAGLRQGDDAYVSPAPQSVIAQVLSAGRLALSGEKEEDRG